MANNKIVDSIRGSISPRKKKNDDSQKLKRYAFIRVPEELKRNLEILKLAYEEMWSERLTQEEFYLRLYQGALRIDPKVKDYLASAEAAYEPRGAAGAAESSIPNPVLEPKENVKRHLLKYFFVNGNEKLPARFSKGKGSFAVTFEGRNRGVTFMTSRGWHLEDENGKKIDNETALAIKSEHEKSLNCLSIPDISDEDFEERMFTLTDDCDDWGDWDELLKKNEEPAEQPTPPEG